MEQNRSVIVVNIEVPIRILKFFLPGLQKPMMTLAPLFPKKFPKVKHIMLLNQKKGKVCCRYSCLLQYIYVYMD